MYDLIIVGGGPSGASAGRAAGKKGLFTLLLEKENFPRYKPLRRSSFFLRFILPGF
jgi:flavin-dependent dehydrogenase